MIRVKVCPFLHVNYKNINNSLYLYLIGITINARIIGSKSKNIYGQYKTFIGELVILAPSARINIKPGDIVFSGASLSWNDEQVFRMEGIAIMVNTNGRHGRTLKINFGNDISVEIRRFMKEDTDRDVSYLNMYINNEKGLSDMSEGILGM